jgi:PAS domain S-box-containing protein
LSLGSVELRADIPFVTISAPPVRPLRPRFAPGPVQVFTSAQAAAKAPSVSRFGGLLRRFRLDGKDDAARVARLWSAVFLGWGATTTLLVLLRGDKTGDPGVAVFEAAFALVVGLVVRRLPWARWPSDRTLWLAPFILFLIMLDNVADGPSGVWAEGYLLVFVWAGLWHVRGSALRLAPFGAAVFIVPNLVYGTTDGLASLTLNAVGLWVLVGEMLAWATARFRSSEDRRAAEQAVTEPALRRQAAELEALHETTLGLLDRIQSGGMLEQIVERAAALMHTRDAWIYVVDPGTDDLVVQQGIGVFAHHLGSRLARGEGLSGRVWESGETLGVPNYGAWEARRPEFQVLRSMVATPLRIGEEFVGVIGVARRDEIREFSAEDRALLGRFGQLASLALHQERLLETAQNELIERHRAEEVLRESESRYRLLFESNPHPMWVFDKETLAFLAVNDAAIHHYGFTRDEFLRMSILDIRPKEDAVAVLASLQDTDETQDAAGEWRHRRKDGSVIDVEVLGHAITFGDRAARLILATDITARKASQTALVTAYEREHQAAEQLRKLDEMKNAFISAVSHELRTPLTSVVGFSDTLARHHAKLPDAEREELVVRLNVNARKLDRLLADLLDVDRLTRGILRPNLQYVGVAELIGGVVKSADYLGGRPVEVEVSPMVIKMDGPKVERIVENLLANAVRHTPEGTGIWVKAIRVPEGALIMVEDAGKGIPESVQATIFEPFEQGPERIEHSPGVGIGLSLVSRFAELHHGRAWVEERVGGGSSFRVFIPEPSNRASVSA